MSKDKSEYETRQTYPIPDNFTEGTGAFGGLVKVRNLVEGCILALPAFLIAWNLPIKNLNMRMIAISLITIGPLLLGCVGLNGDCISVFLGYFFKFRKKRRVIRYNPRVKLEYTGDVPLSREVPIEKLKKLLKNLGHGDTHISSESDAYFAVGRDIAFEDDIALSRKIKARANMQRGNSNGKSKN